MKKMYALVTETYDGKAVFVVDESTGLIIITPNYNTICRYQVTYATDYPDRAFRIKEVYYSMEHEI